MADPYYMTRDEVQHLLGMQNLHGKEVAAIPTHEPEVVMQLIEIYKMNIDALIAIQEKGGDANLIDHLLEMNESIIQQLLDPKVYISKGLSEDDSQTT